VHEKQRVRDVLPVHVYDCGAELSQTYRESS
jgi:hypothetical protein